MYDDSGKVPIGSSKLVIVIIIAVFVVMGLTIVLNGGFSTPTPEEPENVTNNTTSDVPDVQYKMVGQNSYGTVTKISGFGNPSSDIKVALILGVDAKQKSANAIVPTLQNENTLKYCYDVYIVNASYSSTNDGEENNENNLTVNEMSESLASEFAVQDIIKEGYNFTADIHSTNDSNSYVFVPSNDTYTSKMVVDYISNNMGVGRYTPDSHSYTESVSEKIINNNIPSIVYVTKEYYADGVSNEINSILLAIDNFDFINLFNSNSTDTNDTYTSTNSSNSSVTSSVDSDNGEYGKTIVVSNSSGNREVN